MSEMSGILRTYEGAVAIITGGASGIGKALGKELAARGCEVVLADLQLELANSVAADICSLGGKATAYALDVTDADALDLLLEYNKEDVVNLITLKGKLEMFSKSKYCY